MPPGSKGASGGNFVHDPKLAREREIKAQVKLMIQDVTGAACVVERSMVAKVRDGKGEKCRMQTLDGVLTRKNAEGERQSITSRCADLNREMIGAMGVSKAVLENVIFCHQEDSSWPLSEGKALKEKFDAIFASTRYTKVLDEIKKLKQSQDADIREGKKELEYLKQHKLKAQQLSGDLEELQAKLAASVDSVENINTELEPIKAKLEELNIRYNEIYKIQSSRDKCSSEKEHIQKAIQELKDNIHESFEGTTSELEKEVRNFSQQVQKKKDEQEKCKREQEQLATDLGKLEKEKSKLFVEIGKLQNESDLCDTNVKKRDSKILQLSELYNFEEFSSDSQIDEDMYRIFFDKIKQKLTEMMEAAKGRKMEFEEREQKLQAKIDELKANKTKLEHSEKIKKETIAKNNIELKDLKQSLLHMAGSAGRLSSVNADLKRAEKELVTTEDSMKVEDVQREVQNLEGKRKNLDKTINELSSEMIELHKQSEVQTKLDMLLANQKEKEESIERLKAEHDENIQSLLGPVPLDDLRETLSKYISNQGETVKQSNSVLKKLQTNLSTKQVEKTSTSTQLRQKEDELRELENKISSVCDSQDIDSELSEVQRSLTQAQEEKGCLLGAEHMIKKYIRGLERNNPSCPLCSRGFQQAQEIRELILKLQEQLRKVPANKRKAEEEMETHQQKYDEIMQLRPVKEAAANMRNRDIPALKAKLKKLEDEIKSLRKEVESKEEECLLMEGDLQTAKSLQPDIVDMDRRRAEVRQLQRDMEDLRSSRAGPGSGASSRAMNQVIAEKEEKQLELETLVKSLDLRRARLSDHQNKVHALKSRVQDLQGEKLAIEGELQQRTKLEERTATLTSDNANHQRDIEESLAQIRPIELDIDRLVKEKERVTQDKEVMTEKARADVEQVKNDGIGVKNLNTEIKKYRQSGKPSQLERDQQRQADIGEEQAGKENQQAEIAERLQELAEQISGQQVRQRELQDNLELHRKQAQIADLDEKIAALNDKLGDMNLKNLERERQRFLASETNLVQQLHNASSRQQSFKDQIRMAERELASSMYKDANQKYSTKIIENKTTEIVNTDLQKYYGAMDKAIMMYHKSKMEEINVIIQELWKNTYMGNDIDTIEIQSEAEDAAASGTIKSRRTYNYRVVMIKNGIPIDMRGRCSAGQKVLASLIIRLALAETFCVNCGVLALDEPTTNLDRSNIESLAVALVRIIRERSTQRHFQLVVITHDEDFVELLGRSDHVDEYIQVSKNHEGLSQLTVRPVDQLHSG
ncbi:hypothetical protein EGW08_010031 [Elysia chlorotica]|uniref:Zinc-hook domain-containing protein n=1 Tax=Elysia chlorotica TaxID=188477 RepID=A0A433TKU3_ELYCH|nr:hypothetical protein EGW08_010031 [Elysia chlorotica]